jgi:two-component system CheB/CheR fusion protein
VIQHLSPDYKSMMVELLSKRTAMPVRRAEEGMLVEADTVYLIPPRKQLTIFHGRLLLGELDYSRGVNLPIDVFLQSLAEDQSEKAAAVILSGTGSDGVRGVRSVKEGGGVVFVQKPESARFDGMPNAAIATGLADVVLPPDELPAKLCSFTRPTTAAIPDRPQALLSDEESLTRVMALLRDQAKVDFTYYKPTTVLRRIERRMTVNQVGDLREYVRLLEFQPSEVMTLYHELLIGVTSFYRDPEVFEALSRQWLPALFRAAPRREIRFWVAGCSTGEEAYTFAILAQECMESLGIQSSLKIFATDIDRDAIVRASTGSYPESIAADLPPGWLSRYFVRRGDHYQVQRSIREMVVFAQHNLTKDPPFTNMDLLSCRNLLIYLQPVLQQKVMDYVNFSLNPGGLLVLGTSETPGEGTDYFETLHHKFKIYKSLGKKVSPVEGMRIPAIIGPLTRKSPVHLARAAQMLGQREEERLQERLLHVLAEEFAPLILVVNDRLEVLQIAGNPDGILRLPAGKLLNDVSRMAVKELAIPLSTGLQRVFSTGKDVSYTRIGLHDDSGKRVVQMRIRPLPGRKGQEALAVVLMLESQASGEGKTSDETLDYDLTQEAEQRIHDLEQELQFTKENLQATIEELETSNEELQATNEELLASNEELQSTNEELQSVNEELHTVNAEYHSKILELTELTNDLDNLMAATGVGTLFLDENLHVRKFTPQVARLFRISDHDAGRPFANLTHFLHPVDPLAIAGRVEQGGATEEIEVRTTQGDWFLLRALPYRISHSSTSGVLFTFTDINHVKRGQQALEASAVLLRWSQQMAHVGTWRLFLQTRAMEWSDEVYQIFGLKPTEVPATFQAFLATVHPDERTRVESAFQGAGREGGNYQIIHRIVRPDGLTRVVRERWEQNRDELGAAVSSVGVIHDITEVIEAEDAMRLSQASMRSVVDAISAHVALLDHEGRIVYVNEAWREFASANGLDHSASGLGENYLDVCRKASGVGAAEAPDAAQAIVSLLAGERQQFEVEYPCHSATKQRWFRARFRRFETNHGPRVAVVHENITQQRIAENARSGGPQPTAEPPPASTPPRP